MSETGLIFSMAETSRRLGISTATLRKWASRYGIDASLRSPGGHRLYNEMDLERLQLIYDFKTRGWNLNDLAQLDIDSLRQMNPSQNDDDIPGSVSFCGPRVVKDFASWFPDRARILDEAEVNLASGVLVWEVGSLSDQHVARAQRLQQSGVPVLMVHHYALSRRVHQLESAGITTCSGPLNWNTLMHWLMQQSPQSRYTDADLQRLVEELPDIPCECPRHLAELLIKLRDFAIYCQQCSLDSPAQADLHQRLYHWTQAAQRPLETGLEAVLIHEGRA